MVPAMNGVCERLVEVSPLFVKRMILLGQPSEKYTHDGVVITRVRLHPAYKHAGWHDREYIECALPEDNRA